MPWFKELKKPTWKGDGCIGRTPGGKNTKVHSVVNSRGVPVIQSLCAGNRKDFDEAIPLLGQLPDLEGDRAYGTKMIRAYLTMRGAAYTIPPTKNLREPWVYDRERYKRRNVVERFFCRIKDFRRVDTRYDKRPDSFYAFVLLAASIVSFAILHI